MMGVEYDLFWTLTPESLKPFFKAFDLKQKRKETETDIIAWQHGIYIQMAVASVLDSKTDYPKEPLSIINEKEKNITPQDRMEKIKENMMERMIIVNSQFEEVGEIINESE